MMISLRLCAFDYIKCTLDSRNFSKGQEMLFAKLMKMCEKNILEF